MNIPNLYRKIKQILNDSNVALVNRGLNEVDSLSGIFDELGEVNKLPCLLSGDIVIIGENDLRGVVDLTKNIYPLSRLTNLKALTIPDSVTSIGEYAFRGCTSLINITIPDSVTSIGLGAFDGCTSLTDITIPDSVTTIGNYAFYNCESLTSIEIPDSVTSIGEYAFRGCTSLINITIPDSVTSIGDGAFYDCTSLESITIPDSVTNIGYDAFYNCISLTDICLKSVTPPILYEKSSAVDGTVVVTAIPDTTTIHVPVGSGDAYKSATNWSYYSDRIVADIVIL